MQIQGHHFRHQEAGVQCEARRDGGLPDGRPRDYRPCLYVPRHQAPQPQAARGLDDHGRPVLLVRGSQSHLFRQRPLENLITPFPLMPPLTYISAFRRTDANDGSIVDMPEQEQAPHMAEDITEMEEKASDKVNDVVNDFFEVFGMANINCNMNGSKQKSSSRSFNIKNDFTGGDTIIHGAGTRTITTGKRTVIKGGSVNIRRGDKTYTIKGETIEKIGDEYGDSVVEAHHIETSPVHRTTTLRTSLSSAHTSTALSTRTIRGSIAKSSSSSSRMASC